MTDKNKQDPLDELSSAQEYTEEEEERIRKQIEDDIARKGFGPDPIPKKTLLPPTPCPNDTNGKHSWQFAGNFQQPVTRVAMHSYVCSKCGQKTTVPLGQKPTP